MVYAVHNVGSGKNYVPEGDTHGGIGDILFFIQKEG